MAPRIPLPTRAELDPAQREVWDRVVAGPRGVVIGPLRAAIHNAELAGRWSALGEVLRFGTSLPKRLSELAICVTGRRWSSQVEWFVHARTAAQEGIAPAILEAIERGAPPVFTDAAEAVVYDFARELQMNGRVSDATYAAAREAFGVRGTVELTALIGYYTMVSMTLNAHGIPLPDGEREPLEPPPQGLFTLPARAP
ncbi:carboxymuconolactone decarboxylase family protein [Belnapia sp. T6]|uniref:Carboxymuconolactone decarboxylase family protein n=1 Tax=Belnapia mucosa TaxID=2804532 RepID=A0ABS1V337_9PROT|nr:carboxymuconolactone decarboxylase family protein [Belnapia mucosa]MBL6456104.1 carboxymuconolactone decarboxylase family protein [Belnapia mucosa]